MSRWRSITVALAHADERMVVGHEDLDRVGRFQREGVSAAASGGGGRREIDDDRRAAAGSRLDLQRRADRGDSLAHAEQPEPAARTRRRAGNIEAAAVVVDRHAHAGGALAHAQRDRRRGRRASRRW